jgi:polysaccharide biosynthesis protein PslG
LFLPSPRNLRLACYGRRAGLVAGLLLLAGGAILTPLHPALAQAGQRGSIPHTAVNPYGANVFLHKEAEQVKVTKTLDLAAGAHLAWIKQDFPWSDIEITKKGDFTDARNGAAKSAWDKYDFIVDQAAQRNLQVVARVSFAPDWARSPGAAPNDAPRDNKDLADFVVALLNHYKGRVGYIQVWNEPNLNYEWKAGGKVDPAGYTAMLKTVYTAAKAADPNVTILSAPMAITLENIDYAGNLNELDFWDQMYKAGAKDYFDVLSANAYGLDQPPDAAPAKDKLNFRRVELLHDVMVSNGDTNKAVWFNEYGWNASPTTLSEEEQLHWRRVDPNTQAQWTTDGIQYALDHWPWSGVFFIWYLRQVGDIPPDKAEYYFRLVDPDFTLQPVYKAVRRAAGLYTGPGATTAATPGAGATPAATGTAAGAGATPAATGTAAGPTNGGPGAETPAATTAPAGATDTPAAAAATPTAIAATPVPAPAPQAADNNMLPIILGGLVLLAILGGVGYYFMRRAQ